jgi:hypothetical protein
MLFYATKITFLNFWQKKTKIDVAYKPLARLELLGLNKVFAFILDRFNRVNRYLFYP